MKFKKGIYLFLALLFPIGIFLFLRLFGKNEFAVEALYQKDYPKVSPDCPKIVGLPYFVPDSVLAQLNKNSDSLTVIFFGALKGEQLNQFKRVSADTIVDDITVLNLQVSDRSKLWQRCVFFLQDPLDVVMVDAKGTVRGNYLAGDRDDIDRLLTEIDIILKKY
jgi:hypothetical protein